MTVGANAFIAFVYVLIEYKTAIMKMLQTNQPMKKVVPIIGKSIWTLHCAIYGATRLQTTIPRIRQFVNTTTARKSFSAPLTNSAIYSGLSVSGTRTVFITSKGTNCILLFTNSENELTAKWRWSIKTSNHTIR